MKIGILTLLFVYTIWIKANFDQNEWIIWFDEPQEQQIEVKQETTLVPKTDIKLEEKDQVEHIVPKIIARKVLPKLVNKPKAPIQEQEGANIYAMWVISTFEDEVKLKSIINCQIDDRYDFCSTLLSSLEKTTLTAKGWEEGELYGTSSDTDKVFYLFDPYFYLEVAKILLLCIILLIILYYSWGNRIRRKWKIY